MSLEEKWEKDKQPLQPLKNSNLVCNMCAHCQQSVTACEMYTLKPLSVLKGGVCYEFKKQ